MFVQGPSYIINVFLWICSYTNLDNGNMCIYLCYLGVYYLTVCIYMYNHIDDLSDVLVAPVCEWVCSIILMLYYLKLYKYNLMCIVKSKI